jgi:hypothetical protein
MPELLVINQIQDKSHLLEYCDSFYNTFGCGTVLKSPKLHMSDWVLAFKYNKSDDV